MPPILLWCTSGRPAQSANLFLSIQTHTSLIQSSRCPFRLPLVISLLPRLPPCALHPLPLSLPSNARPTLQLLFLVRLLVIQLHQPLSLRLLPLPLIPPLLDPFSLLFVKHHVLPTLLELGTALQVTTKFTDAFLLRKRLPLCGCFGLREGFPARERRQRLRGQCEGETVGSGVNGAGCEELIQKHLGPVAGESVEGGVCGGRSTGEKVGCWWKRVRVVSEEVCEVKGVWNWFCY
jgi:hypothetical protein